MNHARLAHLALSSLALAACAVSSAEQDPAGENDELMRMLSGRPAVEGAELEARIAEASQHPLGSEQNPVRASAASGQRAYLARLRCEDGAGAVFERLFNGGIGAFGNVVDIYGVECPGSAPETREIWLDMYHPGIVETRAVPGYTIVE